jgi:hypothetical protein
MNVSSLNKISFDNGGYIPKINNGKQLDDFKFLLNLDKTKEVYLLDD